MYKAIGIILISVICFVSGWFTSNYVAHKGTTIAISPIGLSHHTLLQSEILALSPIDSERHYRIERCFLNHIEISIKKVDVSITQSNPFMYRITASDKCKETTQDFRVEVSRQGNFKYYVGAAVGAGVIATAVLLLK